MIELRPGKGLLPSFNMKHLITILLILLTAFPVAAQRRKKCDVVNHPIKGCRLTRAQAIKLIREGGAVPQPVIPKCHPPHREGEGGFLRVNLDCNP